VERDRKREYSPEDADTKDSYDEDSHVRHRGIDISTKEEDEDQFGLFKIAESEYGGSYRQHLFDQYKMYIESIDRLHERRSTANTFFLTANTLLISGLGLLSAFRSSSILYLIPSSLAGIALCWAWKTTMTSYRQLSKGRFEMVHMAERKLPLALYTAEWKALGEDKDPEKYGSLTRVESYVPLIFIGLYVCIMVCPVVVVALRHYGLTWLLGR